MGKIVVRATCPKCGEYYELDNEGMSKKEIEKRNEGEIPCPLCQEGIPPEKRRKVYAKWTPHLICGVAFRMLTIKVPAGYKAKLGEPSMQIGDELVLYAYRGN